MILSTLFLAGAFFCFGVASRDLARLFADWRATRSNVPETTEFDHRMNGQWAAMVRDTAGWR